MNRPRHYHSGSNRERAAALIVVLAFVVLLTGLVVAYLSRATTDRQLANASFSNTAADILAKSALDITVGDFKQEIVGGSSTSIPGKCYIPSDNVSAVPLRRDANGTSDPSLSAVPNLVRRSFRNDNSSGPTWISSRASAVNSETDASRNGRSIARSRWNSHYLIPRLNATDTTGDSTPINSFVSPDWVLMTRNGPKAFGGWQSSIKDNTNSDYVIGRYAYAVYDEGGLLDMNVAGYPTSTSNNPTVTDIGRKGIIAFADLTVLPTTGTGTMSGTAINRFVGFRHYATTQQPSSTSSLSFTVSSVGVTSFVNYYLGNPQVGVARDCLSPNRISTGSGTSLRTDQAIATRRELIALRAAGSAVANPNTLQYLGTFSREQNKPTWPQAKGKTVVFPQRFYVGNLAAVQPNPSDSASVKAKFGLQWIAPTYSGSGPSRVLLTHGYWEYQGATGTSKLSAIPTILDNNNDVKSDLDFFQYLNYALFGITGSDSVNIVTTLSMGAALIDQYDANSDAYTDTGSPATCPSTACGGSTTTRIDYTGGSVYGMEDTDSHRPPDLPTDPPSADAPAPAPIANYYCLNRPFRNVGEFGYAWAGSGTNRTIDFKDAPPSTGTAEAALLDFFTYNSASTRAGILNLNTRQTAALSTVLMSTIANDSTSVTIIKGGTTQGATAVANDIVSATSTTPALSRADVARFVSVENRSLYSGDPKTEETKESVARALAEIGQTRTWNLMVDVIGQSGRYPPTASALAEFVVEGEKRYWLHVAIDRFTGEVIDQQLEEVFE